MIAACAPTVRGAPAILDVDLWDEAGWFGVAFHGPTEDRPLPRTGLLFRHAAPATRLFTDLTARIGPRDVNEDLRLGFVEDDARGGPLEYTAIVGARGGGPCRRHRLKDSGALAAFRTLVARHGAYLVVPVVLGPDRALRALYELAIEKRAVEFLRAADPSRWGAREPPKPPGGR